MGPSPSCFNSNLAYFFVWAVPLCTFEIQNSSIVECKVGSCMLGCVFADSSPSIGFGLRLSKPVSK